MSIRSFFGFGFNKPKVFLKKRFDGKKRRAWDPETLRFNKRNGT